MVNSTTTSAFDCAIACDIGVTRLVRLPRHDLRRRNVLVQPLHAVLAEVVVLVEIRDLLPRVGVLDVLAEDLALPDIVGLPAEGVRVLARLVPAQAAGGHEQVRHPLRVEIVDDLGVRRGAQAVEDREDLVLEHQLVHDVHGLGGVVAVVHVLVDDLAAVYAAVGVDVVEVGLGRGRDLAVAGCGRSGQGLMAADRDGGRGDARCGRPATSTAARAGAAATATGGGQGYRRAGGDGTDGPETFHRSSSIR
jgi:hypothetical protein